MKPIVSLQCMRAVAAILVVCFHHINALRDRAAPDLPFFEIGRFGVDIFFVISGFIMWTTTSARPTSGAEFMKRRIIRIVPLYWLFTLVTAFVSTEGGLRLNLPDPVRLAKSLLFVPQWSPEFDLVAPVMLVGWTLELEMLFYAIFACVLFMAPARRLWAMCAILATLTAIGLLFHPSAAIPKAFSDSIVAEFAFGLILGRLYEIGRLPQSAAFAAGLTVASLAMLALHRAMPDVRLIYFGIPAAMLVMAALMMESRIRDGGAWRTLRFLGDASYSIYLSHLMAMAISWKIIPPALATAAPWPVLVFQIVFAIAFGALAYVAVERPITDAARRALAPKTRPSEIVKGL